MIPIVSPQSGRGKSGRRSFGSLQNRPGVLHALLGHANLVTTARYLHPVKAQVQAMVEEL